MFMVWIKCNAYVYNIQLNNLPLKLCDENSFGRFAFNVCYKNHPYQVLLSFKNFKKDLRRVAVVSTQPVHNY